ncbi:MAG: DNA polymerase III subunit gamma/tau [Nitrosomonadales bacterium]|nr:MAG: DNA polymerase III subunit gamma/tau [Nitrosomonadales bacterium]
MSYQVLARKWRPKSFAELVGQEHVVKALSNALDQQRLHHAYLLTGTRGVGKTTVARILAKSLNCETGITSTPCGTCATCREIDAGRFIDLLELDAASNTGIDNMREVLDNAQYAPTAGRFKVYLIDEVHMLSKAAFNSMLKTLEEPPEHVKFILATTDPQKIPVTVLSRCLQFNLKQMPPAAIVGHLKDVLEREGLGFELPALQLLARSAQGSMRDALSLLDQSIAYGGGKVEEAQVRAMLGAIDQSYLFTLLERLADSDGAGLIALAEQMEERSLSFDAALQDLGALLHQIALAQTVPQALSEDLPERQRILELAQRFSPEEVQLHYQITLHGRKDLALAPDEFAGFSMALLRMLAFTPDALPAGGEPAKQVAAPARHAAKPVQAAVAPRPETPPTLKVQEPAPAPAMRSQPASVAAGKPFDGDWPGLVAKLGLGGMAKMLANHCELKSYEGQRIDLCVPEEHKHLMEKAYQDKLKAALDDFAGAPVMLHISLGSVTGLTPAKLDHQEKQARQAEAIAAIEQDPFVRDLVENLDAQVIESTIKPID